ncbi:ABC transporter permease [Maridesulfovibrio sp.]|uniref:ABC transporter permease n=1 Tax=Maridesulfovibrio sp. TaxID=2795000 RepID=UPI002A186CA4|nr:ABC transporter permease [Maridesulfovibrio sp.]
MHITSDSKQVCRTLDKGYVPLFQEDETEPVVSADSINAGQNHMPCSRNKWAGRLTNATLAALLPGALVIAWWLLGRWNILNPYLTPPPGKVIDAALNAISSGELWIHSCVSMARVFAGFTLTACLALPLAALIYFFPLSERLLRVPLELLRVTPPLALIPLLILWLGIGEGSKLAIIVLASFFPIFLNALDGLKNSDKKLLEMAETIDLTRRDTFGSVLLPSALPSVITGLRIGFGYSWRALIGAELIAAASGLGYMILDAEELARTDRMFVGIIVIGVLGYFFDAVLSRTAIWAGHRLHLSREPRK